MEKENFCLLLLLPSSELRGQPGCGARPRIRAAYLATFHRRLVMQSWPIFEMHIGPSDLI